MKTWPKLATARYFDKALIEESGFVPLGHTVSLPRFMPMELAANVNMLAPMGGIRKIEDPDDFTKAYRARLELYGTTQIAGVLSAIIEAEQERAARTAELTKVAQPFPGGAVLLCYEKVHEGEFCHRRVFADWWFEQTGEHVPELIEVLVARGVATR